ncbi:MAG: Maf family protein [Acidimicrobiia bacterium]
MRLVLASSSPRRKDLLDVLELEFTAIPAEIDETRLPDEAPAAYVERVARAKAAEVAAPGLVVIGCDTTVVHDGRVMGKPGHPEEARAMLRRLEGSTHEVFTGVSVVGWSEERVEHAAVDVTDVELVAMTDEEIADYVATGEPMDKAGSYALQGLGGTYVKGIQGSPFTVIGMPIHLLPRMIRAVGGDPASFRTG